LSVYIGIYPPIPFIFLAGGNVSQGHLGVKIYEKGEEKRGKCERKRRKD
jgi:hypothetical protein